MPGRCCHAAIAMLSGTDAQPGQPVLPVVAGEFQPVLLAVLVVGLGPPVDKQVVDHLEIVVAEFARLRRIVVEERKRRVEIVAPAGLELLRQVRGPVHVAGALEVRLVGEHARNHLAKLVAEALLVRVHRDLKEFLRHPGTDQINMVLAPVPRRGLRLLHLDDHILPVRDQPLLLFQFLGDILVPVRGLAVDRVDPVVGRVDGLLPLQRQAERARFGHRIGHVAPGKSRRVGILVVDPHEHVARPAPP